VRYTSGRGQSTFQEPDLPAPVQVVKSPALVVDTPLPFDLLHGRRRENRAKKRRRRELRMRRRVGCSVSMRPPTKGRPPPL
jgi:hypothetical protein